MVTGLAQCSSVPPTRNGINIIHLNQRALSPTLHLVLATTKPPFFRCWLSVAIASTWGPPLRGWCSQTFFYRTRVRSLGMLVSDSLTDWLTDSRLVNLIDVMPTQNLLMLLLLLMLVMRIVLATVCCRFGSWGLVIKLNFCSDFEHFGQDFEVEVQARFWSWSLVSILLLMFGWGYKVESWSR